MRLLPVTKYKKSWTPGRPWYQQIELTKESRCYKLNDVDLCVRPSRFTNQTNWYIRYCPPKTLREMWKEKGILAKGRECRLVGWGYTKGRTAVLGNCPGHVSGFYCEETAGSPYKTKWTGKYVRGTGIGKHVYNLVEEWLVSRGIKEIDLVPKDDDAENFWRKRGFRKKSDRPGEIGLVKRVG